MAHMQRDYAGRTFVLSIPYDEIASLCTAHVTQKILTDEIVKALESDADLRILIRELVADAISNMNLQEIIAAAVAQHFKPGENDGKV